MELFQQHLQKRKHTPTPLLFSYMQQLQGNRNWFQNWLGLFCTSRVIFKVQFQSQVRIFIWHNTYLHWVAIDRDLAALSLPNTGPNKHITPKQTISRECLTSPLTAEKPGNCGFSLTKSKYYLRQGTYPESGPRTGLTIPKIFISILVILWVLALKLKEALLSLLVWKINSSANFHTKPHSYIIY